MARIGPVYAANNQHQMQQPFQYLYASDIDILQKRMHLTLN